MSKTIDFSCPSMELHGLDILSCLGGEQDRQARRTRANTEKGSSLGSRDRRSPIPIKVKVSPLQHKIL
jgi:hypothetical protein